MHVVGHKTNNGHIAIDIEIAIAINITSDSQRMTTIPISKQLRFKWLQSCLTP